MDDIPLIVDNAKCCGSPRDGVEVTGVMTDVRSSRRKRIRNGVSGGKNKSSSPSRRSTQSERMTITKDSRWDTSSQMDPEMESRQYFVSLPARPLPGTFGSPAGTLSKHNMSRHLGDL